MASDMALEVIGDVAIVWFLSPQLRLGSLPSSGFARWTRALPGSSAQARALPRADSNPRLRCGHNLGLSPDADPDPSHSQNAIRVTMTNTAHDSCCCSGSQSSPGAEKTWR